MATQTEGRQLSLSEVWLRLPRLIRIAAVALVVLAIGGIGYAVAQTQFAETHGYFDKTISVNAYVVKIDNGAKLAGYKDLQIGDPVLIKMSESDLNMFQTNQPGITLCEGNGLALTPYLEPTQYRFSECGPIHVVLFPPLG